MGAMYDDKKKEILAHLPEYFEEDKKEIVGVILGLVYVGWLSPGPQLVEILDRFEVPK